MFAGDEEDVAKALFEQRPGFAADFVNGQRDAEDGVVARETAVFAVVDAFVGQIEGREKPDDFAEALLGQLARAAAEGFEEFGGRGGNQMGEVAERDGSAAVARQREGRRLITGAKLMANLMFCCLISRHMPSFRRFPGGILAHTITARAGVVDHPR